MSEQWETTSAQQLLLKQRDKEKCEIYGGNVIGYWLRFNQQQQRKKSKTINNITIVCIACSNVCDFIDNDDNDSGSSNDDDG